MSRSSRGLAGIFNGRVLLVESGKAVYEQPVTVSLPM